MKNVAIFASGSGTNAENIIRYFANHNKIAVKLILSNKKEAFVLERAKNLGVEAIAFSKEDLYENQKVSCLLSEYKIDFIVLAGFLWLMPKNIVNQYKNRILNIHPALLPKYGGKGMYGDNVHKAVIENNEKESGITIHFVNEEYDAGDIIFQAKCEISPFDDHNILAQKVHKLEYQYFPIYIEKIIDKN